MTPTNLDLSCFPLIQQEVEITCNDEPLYKDHTLKFVYVTRWRTKDPPLKLSFTTKKTTVDSSKVKSE